MNREETLYADSDREGEMKKKIKSRNETPVGHGRVYNLPGGAMSPSGASLRQAESLSGAQTDDARKVALFFLHDATRWSACRLGRGGWRRMDGWMVACKAGRQVSR